MNEMLDHPAYKIINKYKYNSAVIIDYIILQNESTNHSYEGHKKAAINAIKIIAKRWDMYAHDRIANNTHCKNMKRKDFFQVVYNEAKMHGAEYSLEQFFALPEDPYYIDKSKITGVRSWSVDQYSQYAYAFLEPPYSNGYVIKDWERLNKVLFSSKKDLEIYRWNTEWSNYFDDGLEWWGAHFWTVYDLKYNIFIVIGASATD